MSATATGPTLGTISDTAVLFFPVPTPWPSSTGCDRQVYRQLDGGSILAWDPVYPSLAGTAAASCYPPQLSYWWFQGASANPSTAMGPTFVCPEAYRAVHSTILDGDSATQTQFTYCCPPFVSPRDQSSRRWMANCYGRNFGLAALPPPTARLNIQCTSTVRPGETLSLLSVTMLTTTATITDRASAVTRQTNTQLTVLPSLTVVQASAATVYGVPVNGYNLVARQDSSIDTNRTTSQTAATMASSLPPPPPAPGSGDGSAQSTGPAPGVIAAAAVIAVIGLALLVLGLFFFVRHRRRRHLEVVLGGVEGMASLKEGSAVSEMPAHNGIHELSLSGYAHELPHGKHAHELDGPM